ncbi:hypothetical protein [Acetobacterium wieringae]|uniref:Uncharacterized protein n=1 Tax=Acetobacterium wieringae TaxID=52694 RepID=A0A5D0WHL8_9FIRM|nr:hypothetical protein FXB42_15410 [Acetobacterium wieringae]
MEVLETATAECLHDLRFGRHRMSCIDTMDDRVCRVGMAGTLAYEVHCHSKVARPVYDAICKGRRSFWD